MKTIWWIGSLIAKWIYYLVSLWLLGVFCWLRIWVWVHERSDLASLTVSTIYWSTLEWLHLLTWYHLVHFKSFKEGSEVVQRTHISNLHANYVEFIIYARYFVVHSERKERIFNGLQKWRTWTSRKWQQEICCDKKRILTR